MRTLFLLLVMAVPAFGQLPAEQDNVIDFLNEVSVTISVTGEEGTSQGSGTVFVRDGNSYVLSAAHVVDSVRTTREIIKDGQKRTVVEFKPVTVMQLHTYEGRYVGKSEYTGKVVKFSDAEYGEDLVLIQLDKPDAFKTYGIIYKGDLLPLGSPVQHVGSFGGEFGANSYSKGYISQYGRVILGKNYFQTTVTAVAGSSGGAIATESGALYGVLTRGSGESINYCVDYRRIRGWLERANALWIVDHDLKPQSLDGDVEVE